MTWEIVVGIETHAQLQTRSKIFSGASTAFGAAPNTQASAVDIALPGVLPVLNKSAVELAIRFGLAIGAEISRRSIFARKNYFYPDLPKGYQISQFEIPVVKGGTMKFVTAEGEKTIQLTRAHLEEDAGKSLHEDFQGMSGIDLNRAGTPLLEIVSEPELRGSKEAVAYARALHSLVRWIGICDGNMQEGSFRCDANVSVRKLGDTKLGTRCEIKNLNSFRFMEQAIEFEARRQIELIEDGKTVIQETRLYDPDKDETRSMRSKEDAQDYRYFPDPDLLPLVISEEQIQEVRLRMPELPGVRQIRFMADSYEDYSAKLRRDIEAAFDKVAAGLPKEDSVALIYGLSKQDATALVSSKDLADYFEACTARLGSKSAKLCANWVLGEVSAALNRNAIEIANCPISPESLSDLLKRIVDGTISGKIAKDVFDAMWAGEGSPDEIIEKRGLKQISDAGAIEKIVDEALAANARLVEDYRSGKEKAFNALVGQVMKRSQGKANPAQVNELLRRKLSA